MKLARLKPRVAAVSTSRVAPIVAPRISGRRLIERNARFLAEHPFCDCGARAMEVDHRVPRHLGGTDVDSNLQGLCDACHGVKTSAEAAARCGR
jgi:5-methylcytosine-specific restriction enzyme A